MERNGGERDGEGGAGAGSVGDDGDGTGHHGAESAGDGET